MHDLILLIAHVFCMLARLAGTAGVRSVIAESALLKHQLLIVIVRVVVRQTFA